MSFCRNYLKNIAGRNKLLIQNFSYLSAVQVLNLLIPLVTYPYLIRTLGKNVYGLIVFAQAIVNYLTIMVSFGFNISATRQISVNRDNPNKIDEIFSSTMIIKIILFFLSCAIMCILLFVVPKFHDYEGLFILSLWGCLYEAIFPLWYFQGVENMKYITYINLASRLIFLCLIFVLIHSPADYLWVPIIYGIGAFVAGIISLLIINKKHHVKFSWQRKNVLLYYFKDSIPIFISNISTSLYVNTNKVLTGAFLNMADVAYYDLAEKITSVMKLPQSILSQSIFPKISKEKNISFIKKIFNLSLVMNLLILLVVLMFSRYAIILLGGKQMLPAVVIVNILALTVPIIAMSNVFGIQTLIPFGYNRSFSRVIVSSGLIYSFFVLILWLMSGFSVISVSIVTVIVELYVTIYMYYYCKKYQLWT